jgi:hypothetical protein
MFDLAILNRNPRKTDAKLIVGGTFGSHWPEGKHNERTRPGADRALTLVLRTHLT